MARKKSHSRRFYVKSRSRRHSSGGLGGKGLMGAVIAGAVAGIGTRFLAPYAQKYVPSIMGLSAPTIAALGAGIVGKVVLKKGGNWTNGFLILGSAMAASELMGNFGMGGTAQATSAYANDQ